MINAPRKSKERMYIEGIEDLDGLFGAHDEAEDPGATISVEVVKNGVQIRISGLMASATLGLVYFTQSLAEKLGIPMRDLVGYLARAAVVLDDKETGQPLEIKFNGDEKHD